MRHGRVTSIYGCKLPLPRVTLRLGPVSILYVHLWLCNIMNPVLVDEFYESTIYTFVITHTIKIYRRHTKDIDIENTTPSKTTHHTTDTLPTLHLPPSLTHSPPQQPFPYFQNPPTPQSRIPTLPTPNQTRYTIPPLPPQLNTRSLPLPFKHPKLGKIQPLFATNITKHITHGPPKQCHGLKVKAVKAAQGNHGRRQWRGFSVSK
ncbi:hypothetical protein F9C07_2107058 [Aspergillus flavus]|uniref:Uncharacterized protein n=1 Tax=Aspergillus flavus (strain ATCC 200026 / FGSC A1120 / IAM 13836 / NRRL 3357 / JCM 12722 / SRRC 167) TaxID=332952 RepID=A0A7U2QZN0_ASPFN|nr:hypothetical protein F9C07_2107058 [Aspergillus flavus]